jgi:hypothetical protein
MADIEMLDGDNADAYTAVQPYKTAPELELRVLRKAVEDVDRLVKRLQVDLQEHPGALRQTVEFYLRDISGILKRTK